MTVDTFSYSFFKFDQVGLSAFVLKPSDQQQKLGPNWVTLQEYKIQSTAANIKKKNQGATMVPSPDLNLTEMV